MKQSGTPRAIVAQGLIACALLAGAAAVFVGPLRDDLAIARSRLRDLREQVERAAQTDPAAQPATETPQDSDARVEEIRRRSQKAADSGALYEEVMRLGAACGVRIDRLEPKSDSRQRGGTARDGSTFSIQAVGTYENLTRFLAAVEDHAGFVATAAVRMTPAPEAAGEPLLAATFETTHRAIAIRGATAGAEQDESEGTQP